MVFGLFKRKDPICGMKETKGKGIDKDGKWFCNKDCLKKFEEAVNKSEKEPSKGGSCCH